MPAPASRNGGPGSEPVGRVEGSPIMGSFVTSFLRMTPDDKKSQGGSLFFLVEEDGNAVLLSGKKSLDVGTVTKHDKHA